MLGGHRRGWVGASSVRSTRCAYRCVAYSDTCACGGVPRGYVGDGGGAGGGGEMRRGNEEVK